MLPFCPIKPAVELSIDHPFEAKFNAVLSNQPGDTLYRFPVE